MKEIKIKVEGMVCTGCENRVVNALKLIDGIADVKASFQNGTVDIQMEEEVTIELIREKIENLGFTVVEE